MKKALFRVQLEPAYQVTQVTAEQFQFCRPINGSKLSLDGWDKSFFRLERRKGGIKIQFLSSQGNPGPSFLFKETGHYEVHWCHYAERYEIKKLSEDNPIEGACIRLGYLPSLIKSDPSLDAGWRFLERNPNSCEIVSDFEKALFGVAIPEHFSSEWNQAAFELALAQKLYGEHFDTGILQAVKSDDLETLVRAIRKKVEITQAEGADVGHFMFSIDGSAPERGSFWPYNGKKHPLGFLHRLFRQFGGLDFLKLFPDIIESEFFEACKGKSECLTFLVKKLRLKRIRKGRDYGLTTNLAHRSYLESSDSLDEAYGMLPDRKAALSMAMDGFKVETEHCLDYQPRYGVGGCVESGYRVTVDHGSYEGYDGEEHSNLGASSEFAAEDVCLLVGTSLEHFCEQAKCLSSDGVKASKFEQAMLSEYSEIACFDDGQKHDYRFKNDEPQLLVPLRKGETKTVLFQCKKQLFGVSLHKDWNGDVTIKPLDVPFRYVNIRHTWQIA